jgi:hypothetical protein
MDVFCPVPTSDFECSQPGLSTCLFRIKELLIVGVTFANCSWVCAIAASILYAFPWYFGIFEKVCAGKYWHGIYDLNTWNTPS